MIKYSYSKVKDLSNEQEKMLFSLLSDPALERLASKKNKELYRESLCAYYLLYEMIGAEKLSALNFSQNGKPYFDGLDACVSLSHTKRLVACAISESKDEKVGIDIEDSLFDKEKEENLALRFFTESEKKALSSGTPFLEIWTKKEALFKFLDTDLPFTSLDTQNFENIKFESIQLESSFLSVCMPDE